MDGAESFIRWCERLYDEMAAGLIVYGRALGLGHAEAEDVLQETFVSVLRSEQRPLDPQRYLIRSYRNRVLNHRRSLWRRLTRELEARCWFEPAAEETELERCAMACLAKLPVAQREVIVLKIWNRMTFEAIGELLLTSPNTVAGRYRYGLEKIRKLLETTPYERLDPRGATVAWLETAQPFAQP